MEIALLSKSTLRIKGKNVSLAVDPQDKQEADAALVFRSSLNDINAESFEVVIYGPGEYETGGVKITGIKSDTGLIYSATVDSVSVLVGKATSLEKMQNKLKEANIVVVYSDIDHEASFLTSLATNVILLYGEKASEVGKSVSGEELKRLQKFSGTIDKLPAEVETIILE
jgi:hypothetical protein